MRSAKFWVWAASCGATWLAIWLFVRRWHLISDATMDQFLVLAIGGACLLAALGMVVVRRYWAARALGIFGIFAGFGWTYFNQGLIWSGWRAPFGRAELDGARSVLLPSVILFLFGFCRWALAYHRGREDHDIGDGMIDPKGETP
jgi:hypothetical protein